MGQDPDSHQGAGELKGRGKGSSHFCVGAHIGRAPFSAADAQVHGGTLRVKLQARKDEKVPTYTGHHEAGSLTGRSAGHLVRMCCAMDVPKVKSIALLLHVYLKTRLGPADRNQNGGGDQGPHVGGSMS